MTEAEMMTNAILPTSKIELAIEAIKKSDMYLLIHTVYIRYIFSVYININVYTYIGAHKPSVIARIIFGHL